jgi:hypothetical protein
MKKHPLDKDRPLLAEDQQIAEGVGVTESLNLEVGLFHTKKSGKD